MHIPLRDPADRAKLDDLIRRETNAKQRDRYRVVKLAVEGQETKQIMQMVGRSRGFVQAWAYAYRDHGLKAVKEEPRPGRPTKLPRDQEEAFKQRLLAGPVEADGGVCTLRGRDAQRILASQFGVQYTLEGVYDLMHRLNLSCLKPRPRHRKNDPQAMKQWLDRAPLLSSK